MTQTCEACRGICEGEPESVEIVDHENTVPDAPIMTAEDEDAIRAFRLLDVVAKEAWSLCALYFAYQEDSYRAQLRRFIKSGPGQKRQRSETVTGFGNSQALAVIRVCTLAMEDE